jgi:glutamine synthetase
MTSARQINWPTVNGRLQSISELFNEDVFTLATLSKTMPKPIYGRFIQQIKGRQSLDKATADAVAHAVRVWAMEKGATHFTHWFQPQTGTTACKHDNFLTLKSVMNNGVEEVTAIDAFSGSQLLQSEPDASSFPNGGMRSTFEARGYTIWDTISPMFLRKGPHGTSVLYIPSVFISYNGEALDEKTILLRSQELISTATVKMLGVLGDSQVKHVTVTLGIEQEFFLVDRETYKERPDLKVTGRTLLGSVPPKHQQLDDHYFGQIPNIVLSCISEVELELFRLGVPNKTRHNEVAPNQFELAPIFEESSVAVDHNLLTMETLHTVAHRHGLKVLFHEKPFQGVNGSGKHANWAMSTDSGENLLEPTLKPESNLRFLLCLVAILDALHKHSGLLRAGIASSSNEHRLGANEAPPGIISAFLGDHLNEVLNSIEENRDVRNFSMPHLQTVKVGGTVLDLKVSTLPTIQRDLTDRNRTSPFAFTGNKFEFRAVGSKQSPSFPVCILNTAISASIDEITAALLKQKGTKANPSVEDIYSVIRVYITRTKNIRFEGNNYHNDWVIEAERRGLPNIKTAPLAFAQILEQKNIDLMVSQGILSLPELTARYHIMCEKYSKDLLIEANTLKNMILQGVMPAVFSYRKELADSLCSLKAVGIDIETAPERQVLVLLSKYTTELSALTTELAKCIDQLNELEEPSEQATFANNSLLGLLEKTRVVSDLIENYVPDHKWPFPKYTKLFFC